MLLMYPLAASCFKYAAVKQLLELQLQNVGNGGCTLITKRFAGQLGLVDFDGNPTQAHLRKTRVQGVVAGDQRIRVAVNGAIPSKLQHSNRFLSN